MATPFAWTLRSLARDSERGTLLALGTTALLLGVWLGWFLGFRLPVYVVSATARLTSGGEPHPVASPVEGRVVALGLRLGEVVQQGQVLAEIEATEVSGQLEEERARVQGVRREIEAIEGEIDSARRTLAAQVQKDRAARAEADAAAAQAEEAARLAEIGVERAKRLAATGLIPDAELEQVQSVARQRRAAAEQLARARTRVGDEGRLAGAEFEQRVRNLERERLRLEDEQVTRAATVGRLAREVERYTLRAPVAGRVVEVAPLAVGAVVKVGESLGAVVPRRSIEAQAEFRPEEALGRVRPGQPARVRLAGFPAARLGSLPARVLRVASEPHSGMIRVELSVEPAPGVALPLEHGVPGTAEVEVERLSPAELFLRAAGKLLDTPSADPRSSVSP